MLKCLRVGFYWVATSALLNSCKRIIQIQLAVRNKAGAWLKGCEWSNVHLAVHVQWSNCNRIGWRSQHGVMNRKRHAKQDKIIGLQFWTDVHLALHIQLQQNGQRSQLGVITLASVLTHPLSLNASVNFLLTSVRFTSKPCQDDFTNIFLVNLWTMTCNSLIQCQHESVNREVGNTWQRSYDKAPCFSLAPLLLQLCHPNSLQWKFEQDMLRPTSV